MSICFGYVALQMKNQADLSYEKQEKYSSEKRSKVSEFFFWKK